MEEESTYSKLGWRNYWTAGVVDLGWGTGDTTAATAIANFRSTILSCPSCPMPRRVPPDSSRVGWFIPSYVGVMGASDSGFSTRADRCPDGSDNTSQCFNGVLAYTENPTGSPVPYGPEAMPFRYPPTRPHEQNSWWGRSPHTFGVKLHAIADGLSKTIAIGEQSGWGIDSSTGNQNECRSAVDGRWSTSGYSGRNANLTRLQRPLNSKLCGMVSWGWTETDSKIGFRSVHGPGAQVTFADGRVQWLDESIDDTVYRSLAIRDTGSYGGYLKVMP